MTRIRNLTEFAHSDMDVEIERARAYGEHMDAFIQALAATPTTREIDATCPLCGCRTIYHTRDPKAPGAVMAVCDRCSEGDRPSYRPDTGFLS